MDKSFYHHQLLDLLGDQVTCKKLRSDLTNSYKEQLDLLVEWGLRNNALNPKERKYLKPSVCRIPVIYTLPKIHKMYRKSIRTLNC